MYTVPPSKHKEDTSGDEGSADEEPVDTSAADTLKEQRRDADVRLAICCDTLCSSCDLVALVMPA